MKRLERSEKIAKVDLSSARQTTEYEVEMKSFGINCNLTDVSADDTDEKAEKK